MCAVQTRERTAALVGRAATVLPGASLGSFQLPLEQTVVIAAGRGPRLWDVDGNEYIDLRARLRADVARTRAPGSCGSGAGAGSEGVYVLLPQ